MFLAPRVTKTLVHDAEILQFALRLSSTSNKIRGRGDIEKVNFLLQLIEFYCTVFCHVSYDISTL